MNKTKIATNVIVFAAYAHAYRKAGWRGVRLVALANTITGFGTVLNMLSEQENLDALQTLRETLIEAGWYS